MSVSRSISPAHKIAAASRTAWSCLSILGAALALSVAVGAASPGTIGTVAGNGTQGYSGDGGPATAAELFAPEGLTVDGAGNIFFADYHNNCVREVIAASGNITTVASSLSAVQDVKFDPAGDLIIATFARILKVDKVTGVISTIAGNGTAGYSGDGSLATAAAINLPGAIAYDAIGNLYISDEVEHCVRKVDAGTGVISTIAGNGTAGFSGDGGPATLALVHEPVGMVIDTTGDLFFADYGNQRIREIDAATGIIHTIAGGGPSNPGDGGPATSGQFAAPYSLALDALGNLFIGDSGHSRVRKVDAVSGIISTVAGTGVGGFNGDGIAATAAKLNDNSGLAFTAAGDLLIGDFFNNRIRIVFNVDNLSPTLTLSPSPALSPTPTPTLSPSATSSATATASDSPTVSPTLSPSPTISETPSPLGSPTMTLVLTPTPSFSPSPPVTATPTPSCTHQTFLQQARLLQEGALYPDPFVDRLHVYYTLRVAASIDLAVFDVAGDPVYRQHVEAQPGKNELIWDGANSEGGRCASGVYLLRLQAQGQDGTNDTFWDRAAAAR